MPVGGGLTEWRITAFFYFYCQEKQNVRPIKEFIPPTSIGVPVEDYQKWLKWIAKAHVDRDIDKENKKKYKNRRLKNVSLERYRELIHKAVEQSNGLDPYTGEPLRWDLIGKYDNAASSSGGVAYKKGLALKPTVDHIIVDNEVIEFKICSWRSNDSKSDLTYEELVDFCRRVITHYDAQKL